MKPKRIAGVGLLLLAGGLGVGAAVQPACACVPFRFVYRAAIRSDLRVLSQHQVAHRDSTGAFTADVAGHLMEPSRGVTVTVTEADSAHWAGHAVHTETAAGECWVSTEPDAGARPGATDVIGGTTLWCEPAVLKREYPGRKWLVGSVGALIGRIVLLAFSGLMGVGVASGVQAVAILVW